jgi:hypothetical protein
MVTASSAAARASSRRPSSDRQQDWLFNGAARSGRNASRPTASYSFQLGSPRVRADLDVADSALSWSSLAALPQPIALRRAADDRYGYGIGQSGGERAAEGN